MKKHRILLTLGELVHLLQLYAASERIARQAIEKARRESKGPLKNEQAAK